MRTIKTVCSGCDRPVALDLRAGEVRVAYRGNGVRGSGHVPAGVAVGELSETEDLLMWECPACEYADSHEVED